MTTTQHATARVLPKWSLVKARRRWDVSDVSRTSAGRRARRSGPRTPFTPVSAAAQAVWEMDQSELAAALGASRW